MLPAALRSLTEADAVPQLVLVLEVQHIVQLGLQVKFTRDNLPADWLETAADKESAK